MCLHEQLGVKALTVEDLLQAQKEISAHNRQLKEQTKQLERDMVLLRDHSLLLVRAGTAGRRTARFYCERGQGTSCVCLVQVMWVCLNE